MTANDLLSNKRAWLAFLAIWGGATAYIASVGGDWQFPIISLAVFGVVLSLVAVALTRGAMPRLATDFVKSPKTEMWVILAYLGFYAFVVLGWALGWVKEAFPAGPTQELAVMALKLAVHVVLPGGLLLIVGAPVLAHFTGGKGRAFWLPLIVLGAILFALLSVVSPSLKQIAGTGAPPAIAAAGLVGAFAWVSIEAGLNEEFLFRALLQTRIAAFLKSEAWSVVLASLIFALSHAPGLYLRGGPDVDGWSTNPFEVVAFTIATLAPISILFGVLWSRTRSLLLVILLHGSIDALPATAEFIKTWGLM